MFDIFRIFAPLDLFRVPSGGDPNDPNVSATIELCAADGTPLVTADGNYIGVSG
jgi:hypothetical protein